MVATITTRWIRAVAIICNVKPEKMTISEARDIAFVSENIKNLSEFIENA